QQHRCLATGDDESLARGSRKARSGDQEASERCGKDPVRQGPDSGAVRTGSPQSRGESLGFEEIRGRVQKSVLGVRRQEEFPFRLARLEQLMRLGGLAEREDAIDSYSQLPLRDPSEDFASAPEELVAVGGVVREARTREVDPILRQARWIEGRHRPARLP